jgi:ElaB/YqjD/DUF883 family membrane-anchored ribosome-binding protein
MAAKWLTSAARQRRCPSSRARTLPQCLALVGLRLPGRTRPDSSTLNASMTTMEQDTSNQASSNTSNAAASKPFPVTGESAPAANAPARQQPDSGAAASAAPVVEGLLKRVTQTAHDAVDGVAAKISSTVDGLQGSVSKVGDTRDEWVESAREAIRQHPFAAVGTAVLIGLALRSLASSRDR